MRYFTVLVLVALLVAVDQTIIQPLLVRLDRYAPAINLSGRQRMLSQRLTKAALTIERGFTEVAHAELCQTLSQWKDAHDALRAGDTGQGYGRIDSPELSREWNRLEPHFNAMASAAQQLASNSGDADSVAVILEHEPRFLAVMERIVKLMEAKAAREVFQLRSLALVIASTIFALLLGLGWLVVRPATRAIRRQVDELESRVQQRTEELAAALSKLTYEMAEREKIDAKSQHLAAQLSHVDRLQSIGHLTVGLAHELNHPLGAIVNYAEASDVLLANQPTSDGRLAEFLRHIRDASLRAGQIVRRMRNFVQPQAGEFTQVDVRELVAEVIEFCRPEIRRHQVELHTDLNSTPAIVRADAIQIQQVLVNLVHNALQAMAAVPTCQRQLLVRVVSGEDEVRVDVADSGTGIAADAMNWLFEPFRTSKASGLGIGLSISRSIVENHGGTIWASSSSDQGATLSFILPLILPHAASLEPTDSICR